MARCQAHLGHFGVGEYRLELAKVPLEILAETIHCYPTQAEVFQRVALCNTPAPTRNRGGLCLPIMPSECSADGDRLASDRADQPFNMTVLPR